MGTLAQRALEDEELPERVGLPVLGVLGERQKVEPAGRENLEEQRVVRRPGRMEP